MKREQSSSFEFGDPSAQDAMGSVSESSYSYSPPGGAVFGLSPPESSPRSGRNNNRRRDRPSWVRLTHTPYFDGHLWRKYGQKKIKDAEYPRLYFRCSYREDRQCLASKLLQQKNDDDPPLYEVTYTYEHTCGAPSVSFPDIVAEPPTSTEGLVLRFDSPGGDAWMQQNGRYHSTSRSAFMMLSFGSSSQTHDQQAAVFRSDLEAGSPSFPTEGLPPAPPPANDDDEDMLSKLNSFAYDFDNQMHFGDHTYLPHNSSNYDHDDH
ncbi:putative WRKY transcription factor 46 [Zea mays]|uniref:Putative WRKY transcription factor 46 n=1 Tax=Zea mays TaxID=4577 RepID=A0A3L6FNM4_MAIZE|nr:putative WRKY transcription factor 46 [Zea mays]